MCVWSPQFHHDKTKNFIFRIISFAEPISNPFYFLFTIFVRLSKTNTHTETADNDEMKKKKMKPTLERAENESEKKIETKIMWPAYGG